MQRSFGRIAEFSLVVLSIIALGRPAIGQSLVQDRILQPVNESALTTLAGNVHPLAIAANDRGAAPVSQLMGHVKLILQRSPAQEAALDAYLIDLQNKKSPNYHKWLTPSQFGALYGPSDNDVQKLTAWLQSCGLTVNEVSSGRTMIDFSGSVGQVQDAFHIAIHSFSANGVEFIANTTNPQIPSAFSAVVAGVAHLNTLAPKALHTQGPRMKFDAQTHQFTPLSGASGPHAQYTVNLSNNGNPQPYYLGIVPADAATIYDTPNSTLNANFSGGTSYNGTGVTIGIAGQSSIDPTYVTNYRTLFLGDTKAPVITNIDGVGDVSGDDGESYLDLEVSGGLAPGATIHFYTESATTGNGVIGAAEQAIADNTVDILSVSYGNCELFNGTSGNQELNSDWQQAAAQGITVVVSAGDSGSAACDDDNTETQATGPLAVNGFASTPYNIAVGGTDFDVLGTTTGNFSNYVSTSAGSATTLYRTVKSPIPENTWNDGTGNNTTLNQNLPIEYYSGDPTDDSIVAGGGGQSNCAVNSTTNTTVGTCTSGYAKPSWQAGSGVPNDNVRDIPDVSLMAGDGFYNGFWVTCDGSSGGFDSNGNGGTATCVSSNGDFYTDGVGGTSAAAPAFAGIMALVVQKTGQRQGQAAPILYSLFASNPSVFHDITVGNNSVNCTPSTVNTAVCLAYNQGYYFMSGFNSNVGYDLATGIGSVDATLLVNNWTSASGAFDVANVAATPSATSIATTQPLSFGVNVTPLATGGAVPAGTITASDGTYTSTAVTLASGSGTITIPANSLTANPADVFTVSYAPASGSAFAPASAAVTVAITQGTAPEFSITGGSIAVVEGASGAGTISVTPSGGFTGAVNLTCTVSGPTGATSVPTCSLTPTAVTITGTAPVTTTLNVVTTATTTAGAYTVTVNGADAATGKVTATGAIPLTVTSANTPTLAVSGAAIAIAQPGQSGTSAIYLTPGGGFTGTVALTCTVTGGSGAISIPTCALVPPSVMITGLETSPESSTLTVSTQPTTSTGNYTVTVSAAATGVTTATVPIAVTVSGTSGSQTITLGTPTTATVSSPGQSGTATVPITTNYSPATINFSCALASAPANAATAYNPGCTVGAVNIASGSTTGTATVTFSTTAPTSGALAYPKTNRWYTAVGGTALACMLFFGIPARRRGWKSMLSLLVFLVAMAGVGCGGGGGGGTGSTGTTTGTYTYTVTGTDSVTSTVTSSATVTVTVN